MLGASTDYIVGMDLDEGRALLDELYDPDSQGEMLRTTVLGNEPIE